MNGAINDSATTITLTSTTNMQAPGYIVIDREDGSGTATPSSREVVKFTGISSNDLTGCTRGADGSTARSHSDGALVETMFTVGMHNDQRDAINAEHDTDGTHTIIAAATITQGWVNNAHFANATINALDAVDVVSSNASIGILSAPTITSGDIIMGDSAPNIDVKFLAYRSGSAQALTANSAATVAFNTEVFDIGGDYNNTTGVFTAPVDGYYYFNAAVVFGIAADQDGVEVGLLKNGAGINTYARGSGTGQITLQNSRIYDLSANDEVAVTAKNASNDDNVIQTHTYFEGHLLSI